MSGRIYIGVDSGATTTKIAAVHGNGEPVVHEVLQRPTESASGRSGVIDGWIRAIEAFLSAHGFMWEQIAGVGLAIPGPYLGYGIMDRSANFPAEFAGWNVHDDFAQALSLRAGRPIPLVVGNDGNFGGVAEARLARHGRRASVLMLMPGSGLGCAYIDADDRPLDGDTLAGLESGHQPAAMHMLGWNKDPLPCGCGRQWGCVEAYTTISGLGHLLEEKLAEFPDHELATSALSSKIKVLSLRDRAQKGDPLATSIFDLQARVMGLHVASLIMTLDASIVVIGGGLMDPGATTEEFRDRYLCIVRKTAQPFLWPAQREKMEIVPARLGDLSQAIGAALVALAKSD
jgi:predicted NBD/HSP70 family sugar kinase